MARLSFVTLLLFIAALSTSHLSTSPPVRASLPAHAGSTKPLSLCAPTEQVVWSCETVRERKLASICSSRDLDETRGYVQYRFGRLGRIELEFPGGRTGTQRAFRYSRYTRPLVTYLKLVFSNDDVIYTISDDSNEEEKPAGRYAAITVKSSDANARETTLRCRMPVAGSLMKLEGVVVREDY